MVALQHVPLSNGPAGRAAVKLMRLAWNPRVNLPWAELSSRFIPLFQALATECVNEVMRKSLAARLQLSYCQVHDINLHSHSGVAECPLSALRHGVAQEPHAPNDHT
jgi:hypothetical protein